MNPSLHQRPGPHSLMTSAATDDRVVDDLAKYFDRVQRWEASALARLTTDQRAVGFGDHWTGLSPDDDFLFGRVAMVEECADRERRAGADDDEIAESTRTLHEAYARGYLLGDVFSAERPDGDFETVHRCNILHRITAVEFAVAQVFTFDVGAMRRAGILHRHPDGQRLVFTTTA